MHNRVVFLLSKLVYTSRAMFWKKSNNFLATLFLFFVGLFLPLEYASAGTVTWVGVQNGSWHAPANWDVGQVPSSTSDVVIASNTPNIVLATTTINFSTLTVGGAANATNTIILSGVIGTGGSITIAASGTLSFATTTAQAITGSLIVQATGTLTHEQNTTAQTSTINFSANTITINAGGSVNVDGKGYKAPLSTQSTGYGPGAGTPNGAFSGSGGGHGGNGGNETFSVNIGGVGYCTISDPSTIGSSGGGLTNGSAAGGAGGGLIRLTATDSITINGTITAKGAVGGSNSGGGAGGGVKLVAGTIAGTPQSFSVAGGIAAAGAAGGGGGGGCVYVEYTTSNSVSTTASYYSMAGGTFGGSSSQYGGAGLTYIKQVGQTGSIWSASSFSGADTPLNETLTIDTLSLRTSTFAVSSTRHLTISNTAPFFSNASGTLRIKSGATTTLSTVGTLNLRGGGSINISSGGYLVGPSITGLSLSTSSVFFLNASSNVLLPLTNLSMLGGSMYVNAGTSFPNAAIDTFNISAGYFSLAASTTFNLVTTSLFINGSSTVILGASSTLSQTIDTVTINHGHITIGPRVTFSSTTVSTLTVGNGSVSSTLEFSSFTTSTVSLNQFATITVNSKGLITHTANTTAQAHIINISATTVTVNAGGMINTDLRGYSSDNGPGKGLSGGSFSGGGGAHGGNGGAGNFSVNAGGTRYCTTSSPSTIGSGGGLSPSGGIGGLGGGLIIISATGTLTVSGSITAKGGVSATDSGGGGAGGAIKLVANVVTGTPQALSALGGAGASSSGGAGGGCIYVGYYGTNSITTTGGYYSVAGGAGASATAGSAGASVFLQLNSAPSLASLVLTASTTGSGYVDISVQVSDADTNNVSLKTEYKSGTCASYTGQATTTLITSATSTYFSSDLVVNNSAANGFQLTTVKTTSGSNTVYYKWNSIANVPSGSGQYCIFVTPNDGSTNGAVVSSTVTIDNVPPSAPGNLTFYSTSTQSVTLRFGASSTDANFSEYKIFYKAGSSGVLTSDSAFTSSTDTNLATSTYNSAVTTSISGLSSSTQYVFNIWIFDTFGNSASATTEVAGYTLAGVPESGQGTLSSSDVSLSWASSNPTTTEFYATNSATGESSGWVTSTSWFDTSVSCGRTYAYTIKARNGNLIETDSLAVNVLSGSCGGYSAPLVSWVPVVEVPLFIPTSTPIIVTSTPVITLPVTEEPFVLPPFVPYVPYAPYVPRPPLIVGTGSSQRFTRQLSSGQSHNEVKYLQQFLNELSFTVSRAGAGSKGKETLRFGAATRSALIKFQRAHGLRQTGKVDEGTRAKLNTLWDTFHPEIDPVVTPVVVVPQVAGVTVVAPSVFTQTLASGAVGPEVLALQRLLNREGYTVARTGPGSVGRETNRFGAATRTALKTLQKNYGLAQTGTVDAPTRALLNDFAR